MEKLSGFSVIKSWQTETPVLRSLEKVVGLFNFDSFPRIQRAAFVDIYKGEETQKCFDALLQNPASPVVLMDIGGGKVLDYALKKSPYLTQVVRFPNVRMIDSLKLIAELPILYQQPRFSLTQEQSHHTNELILSGIRHDLGHALRGSTYHDKSHLIERARKQIGLKGSDDEIVQVVMNTTSVIKPSEYMQVNGVGIDWEGTLFQNGVFMQDRLNEVKSEATQDNIPLMIWTGGDVDSVYRILKQNGIVDVDVAAKQDCAGLEIPLAFDDEEKTILEKIYGFKIGTLNRLT